MPKTDWLAYWSPLVVTVEKRLAVEVSPEFWSVVNSDRIPLTVSACVVG